MISAQIVGSEIVTGSAEAFTLNDKSRWGEKVEGKIVFSPVEAAFLVRDGKMKIFGVRAEMSEEEALKKLHKLDSRLSVRLPVFSDLRKKGYIVKTALKFGAEFRVYEKGAKPGEEHARWVLYAIKESEKMTWHDFSAKNRVAHSTKKKLLLAIVDDETEVTYYEIGWIRP